MHKYLIIVLLLISEIAEAQQDTISANSLSGMVIYDQEIKVRTSAFTTDTLKFNRTQSIFSWNLYNPPEYGAKELAEKYPGAEIVGDGRAMTGQTNHYDITKDSLYSRMSLRYVNRVYYLKEKASKLNWEITDSTKMVGNYTTQKATTHFRGREYTAWFTPEVPLPFGPWKLHGLPGLILQAYDKSGKIYFSAKSINFTNVGPIGPISLSGGEQVISLTEYMEIINNFKKRAKGAVIKRLRVRLSAEQIANLPLLEFPDFELMETFEDNDDQ